MQMNHFLKIVYLLTIGYSNLFSQIKLDVSTIPKRVDVYLDGVNLGTSPVLNERIKPGLHKFEIKKKGFAPLEYDLLVNPAQAIKLDFFLNPIYKIKFKTEEKGLVFELNGEHRWDVPFIRLELEAGDHFLRVFKIGEIIDEQTIRVDEPKRFNYYLKKPLTSG
jgi:hypothetical protein